MAMGTGNAALVKEAYQVWREVHVASVAVQKASGQKGHAMKVATRGIARAMGAMLQQTPSIRLLKHVIRCYLRLSDNPRAREALRQCLPECLQADPSLQTLPEPIANCLREDSATKRWLSQLLQNLNLR